MKKRVRAYHKQFSTARPRPQQMRSRSTIRWVLVPAVCIATFIFVLGIASAAQNSGGPPLTLAQKEQGIQQLLNAGRAHLRPKPAEPVIPLSQPAPQRQAGIVDMHQGPFPPSVFTVRNFWQGPVGSSWVLDYAGAKTNLDGTAGQGGCVLYTETTNTLGGFDIHPLGTFLAPAGTTALTITAADGNLLRLRTATGTKLTFNLQTHQFQG